MDEHKARTIARVNALMDTMFYHFVSEQRNCSPVLLPLVPDPGTANDSHAALPSCAIFGISRFLHDVTGRFGRFPPSSLHLQRIRELGNEPLSYVSAAERTV